jgi:hypothetical protein
MSETALCWICAGEYNPALGSRYFKGHGYFGVCPACCRHAAVGKAVIEREASTDCYCNHQNMCWVCLTQQMFEEMKGAKP